MSVNKLLEFRTMYLRAVPEAWVDAKFRDELTSAEPGAALRALAARFDYRWPWEHVCDLEVASVGNKFEWVSDEWVWARSLEDTLTLRVPLNPEALKISPEHQAFALTDYYRQRPSLFGDDWGGSISGSPSPGGDRNSSSRSHGPPRGGFIAGDDFASFQVALLGAMAEAWRDPSFRRTLTVDAATALYKVRAYELPWKLTVVVVEDDRSSWHPRETPGSQSHWTFKTRNTLRLNFPTKPAEVTSWPVALATYNETGAEYPFSCCT
jgi:ribosomally synthesized peptide (two-chain TOMM family)